jgi:integrase/recombinase XerD
VPLGEPAAAWVDEYLSKSRGFFVQDKVSDVLFVTHHGRLMANDTLNDLVKRQAKAAGLQMKVTPHTLRHCCASHMVAEEARLRHVQELLGHISSEATKVYTQVGLSDLKEAHRRYHPRESL